MDGSSEESDDFHLQGLSYLIHASKVEQYSLKLINPPKSCLV